jgi:hypothetical protein
VGRGRRRREEEGDNNNNNRVALNTYTGENNKQKE